MFTPSSLIKSLRRRWWQTSWIPLHIHPLSFAVALAFTGRIPFSSRRLSVGIGDILCPIAAALVFALPTAWLVRQRFSSGRTRSRTFRGRGWHCLSAKFDGLVLLALTLERWSAFGR